MKRALITGVDGFVGYYLAEHLLEEGYSLTGLDVQLHSIATAPFIDNISVVSCDILDRDLLEQIISEHKPEEIYHLAALANIPQAIDQPKQTLNVNIMGTLNLLEAVRSAGVNSRLLIVGSASEYGVVSEGDLPIDENVPLNPGDPYSLSKVCGGLLAAQYWNRYSIPVIRVRPFTHIGPRQPLGYVTSDFSRQLAMIGTTGHDPTILVGNLDTARDFTDVRDIVRAYRLALRDCRLGEVYNICSGRAVSIREILTRLVELSTLEVEIIQSDNLTRVADNPILWGNCTAFEELTGWQPEIPLSQTLLDILHYWKSEIAANSL
ncbi:GDP-mannose 4,6-dehydratase [Gemmatimonadota bacterium]